MKLWTAAAAAFATVLTLTGPVGASASGSTGSRPRSLQGMICSSLIANLATSGLTCDPAKCGLDENNEYIEIECQTEPDAPKCSSTGSTGPQSNVCADVTLRMTLTGTTASDATVQSCYVYVEGRSPGQIAGKELCVTYSPSAGENDGDGEGGNDEGSVQCGITLEGRDCACRSCGTGPSVPEGGIVLDCSAIVPGMVTGDCRALTEENIGVVPVFADLGDYVVDPPPSTAIFANDTSPTAAPTTVGPIPSPSPSPSPTAISPPAADNTTALLPPPTADAVVDEGNDTTNNNTNTTATTPPPGAPSAGALAASCIKSGGTPMTSDCCNTSAVGTDPFPDTCSAVGACGGGGCSPEDSQPVLTCSCPTGACFDGTECVVVVSEGDGDIGGDGGGGDGGNETATATPSPTPEESYGEALCIETGGNVTVTSCCRSVADFPDTCSNLVGACGCGPADSRNVSTCACPDGGCYDMTMGCDSAIVGDGNGTNPTPTPTGTPATTVPNMTERCLETGGRLTTATLCCPADVGDFPNMCLIGACGCAPPTPTPTTAADGLNETDDQNATNTMDGPNATESSSPNAAAAAAAANVTTCACPDDACFDGETGCVVVASEGTATVEPTPSPTDDTTTANTNTTASPAMSGTDEQPPTPTEAPAVGAPPTDVGVVPTTTSPTVASTEEPPPAVPSSAWTGAGTAYAYAYAAALVCAVVVAVNF